MVTCLGNRWLTINMTLLMQIDTLLNKEMEKYSAIDFYDDLHEKFESNITQKV